MGLNIKESNKVSNYFAFFLIYSTQVNVGLFGFQRYITKEAGHDSWISVIYVGISIHLIMWVCYQILDRGKNDIISIQKDLFGKYIGGLLNLIIITYFLALVIIWTRTYIEVIEIWMFPFIDKWWVITLILLLVYYYVSGGFRVVTGISFFSGLIIIAILLTLFIPIREAHFSNLFPIYEHSQKELFEASREMIFSYLGFEFILIFYPFLKNPQKTQKWSHLGVLLTTIIYLSFTIVSIAYFNPIQLTHTVWPTLSLWQKIQLPFIERFEYVGISLWLFFVLPGICIGLWTSSRGIRNIFNINQRLALITLLAVVFIITNIIEDRQQINMYTKWIMNIGTYFLFLYLPFLYLLQTIIYKVRKRKT